MGLLGVASCRAQAPLRTMTVTLGQSLLSNQKQDPSREADRHSRGVRGPGWLNLRRAWLPMSIFCCGGSENTSPSAPSWGLSSGLYAALPAYTGGHVCCCLSAESQSDLPRGPLKSTGTKRPGWKGPSVPRARHRPIVLASGEGLEGA